VLHKCNCTCEQCTQDNCKRKEQERIIRFEELIGSFSVKPKKQSIASITKPKRDLSGKIFDLCLKKK